jgi:hypothetical protein
MRTVPPRSFDVTDFQARRLHRLHGAPKVSAAEITRRVRHNPSLMRAGSLARRDATVRHWRDVLFGQARRTN